MDFIIQFGAGLAQRVTSDFLGLLIILPIAILIDVIIRSIRKKADKNKPKTKLKTTAQQTKKLTKKEKELIAKNKKKENIALWILFWMYAAPVICITVASLVTVMTGSAEVMGPTAIITLIVIIGVLAYNRWSKKNGK